jgi:hypothetical protein
MKNVRVSDLESLRKSLQTAKSLVPRMAKELVGETGTVIFQKSKQLVPRETGTLLRSGLMELEQFGNTAVATITYGNQATMVTYRGQILSYGIFVHEIPRTPYISQLGHQRPGNKHALPTQFKFLSRPVEEDMAVEFDARADRLITNLLNEAFA